MSPPGSGARHARQSGGTTSETNLSRNGGTVPRFPAIVIRIQSPLQWLR